MKKLLTCLLLLIAFQFSFSQINYGIKAGINYGFSGDLTELSSTVNNIETDVLHEAKNKVGFHVGVWLESKLIFGLAIRPELVYTQLKSEYDIEQNANLITNKIDIPILVDAKIIGPLHFFIGPSIQYILSSKLNLDSVKNVDSKNFTLGMQLGTGVEIGNLGLDIRWEKGFKNEVTAEKYSSATHINVDNRPNQIIISASFKL